MRITIARQFPIVIIMNIYLHRDIMCLRRVIMINHSIMSQWVEPYLEELQCV